MPEAFRSIGPLTRHAVAALRVNQPIENGINRQERKVSKIGGIVLESWLGGVVMCRNEWLNAQIYRQVNERGGQMVTLK
jgi:hypothetical protein